MPFLRCKRILSHLSSESVPVQEVPQADFRDCRNSDAPHAPFSGAVVLGNLSLRQRQAGRGTAQKKVIVALSKTSKKEIPMYLRLQEVPDLKRKTLQEFIDTHVEQGTTVECDGYQDYNGLKNVAVDAKVYDCTSGDLMWLHKALSNLKAFLTGTYHGRCE